MVSYHFRQHLSSYYESNLSVPPPLKDKGWVGGKRLELLAAPGADQPLEALRVHLSPFLPLHYTLDRCKLSGWTSWLPKK